MEHTNTFKFDQIKSSNPNNSIIESMFQAEITRDGYSLTFDKVAGTISVFIIDDRMPNTILLYTQHFTLPYPDTIQYGEDSRKFNERKDATTHDIYLSTLYLGAYKSIKNENSIPEELIDFTYRLLIAIHNKENIKLQIEES